MFSEIACAMPCPRFVAGAKDENTGMVQCMSCRMWFLDDDPIDPEPPDA